MSDDEEATTYDWSAHYDAEGNIYYHNSKTDETTWDAPEHFNPPEVDPDEAAAVAGSGKWEKLTDDEGNVYYYNSTTEVTTWDKPEGFQEDDDDNDKKVAAVEEEEDTALPSSPIGGGDDDEDEKEAALPKSPVGGLDDSGEEDGEVNMEDAKDPKASAWEKITDDDGNVYYHNSVTDETSWEKPEGFQEVEEQAAGTKSKKNASDWEKVTDEEGNVYYYNSSTEETTWEKPEEYVEEEMAEGAEVPAEQEEKEEPSKEAVPAKKSKWAKLTAEDGSEYYYNAATDTTQWEKPDDYVEEIPTAVQGNAEPADQAVARRQWQKLTNEEGLEYYYNAATETTQWEKPDDYVEEGAAGWEKYTDGEGRIYYYNAATGETQWEPPEGFVDKNEKSKAADEDDDEFQPSPTRSPSPSAMSEDEDKEPEPEPQPEPEPEPEPEIDPAEKRVKDAEEALARTDSVMEPGCTANVLEVVSSQGGNPEKAIKALIESYHGTTAICGIVAKWLADLRASSQKVKDVNAIVGTATHSVADGIRNTAQDIVSVIAKERFNTAAGQGILQLSKAEAAFLGEMIESDRWRKLLIDLAATNKDDALLMYCIRTISKRGFHRELVKRMNPSEYYAVFNAMLQSEVSVVGKTAISASNDVDLSIGLEELVNDLRRTCTATSYTYLYSIEVLRTLVTMAEEDEARTHGTERTRFRRAIRKWERLSQDLDFAMVDPSSSASTAGSSGFGIRKRRLDVALTVSELHQRQRRRLKPSEDGEVVIISKDPQRNSIETGLLNFLRRFSVGTQVDDRVLDALLPTGLNMQAAAEEIGELLITYPLAIRGLLSHMFRTGGVTRVAPSTKSKCARLVALAVLASEKRARAEIGERQLPDEEAPDEVALTRMLTQGSELCESLSLTASFVVTKTGKEKGALVSPGQQLCNLALKCASVAQGVMIWADDCIKQPDFTSSATYPTFSPSILTIVRILALRHPCTRLEAAEIAFTFLRHSTSGEMSYKKINDIKEQSIRLLLFLVIHGEAPTVLRTLTTQLQQEGEVLKMDGSLLRYLVTGMLDIVKPPISLVFVRLFGALLKTPRCIEALLNVYFKPVYRDKLKKLLSHFYRACSPDIGAATPADVKLVGHLIRTYSVKR